VVDVGLVLVLGFFQVHAFPVGLREGRELGLGVGQEGGRVGTDGTDVVRFDREGTDVSLLLLLLDSHFLCLLLLLRFFLLLFLLLVDALVLLFILGLAFLVIIFGIRLNPFGLSGHLLAREHRVASDVRLLLLSDLLLDPLADLADPIQYLGSVLLGNVRHGSLPLLHQVFDL